MLIVKQRLIRSGERKELLHFGCPIETGSGIVRNEFGRDGCNRAETPEQEKARKDENRKITIQRNKSMFSRLYDCNINQHKEYDKFLTLTFRELPKSIDEGDYELKKFFQKLRRLTKTKFEYLGTRELQLLFDRDGLHYHIVLFGLPFVPQKKLLELWCVGNKFMDPLNMSGVNIKGVKDGFDQIRKYLSSYMLKEMMENDFSVGHKMLVKSNGLKVPEITDFEDYFIRPKAEEIKKGLSFISNRITYYQLG